MPYWTANGPTAIPELPRTPFRYLLQIDTFLVLPGPVPEPAAIGCDVHRFRDTRLVESQPVPRAARRENAPSEVQQETGESGYSVTFANFGSDGTAFVFIDREAAPPRILLFWNR